MERVRASELHARVVELLDRCARAHAHTATVVDDTEAVRRDIALTLGAIRRRRAGNPSGANEGQEAPMASESTTTTDHDEIRRWVEEHDGKPASVRGTEGGDGAGVLRIDFPGGAGEDQLEQISWDEWFSKFDENGLALLYQKQKASGEDSTFHKLVSR